MLIDYISSEGVRIQYDTGGFGGVTSDDLNRVAILYAELHPDRLPSHVFMNLDVYSEYSRSIFKGYAAHSDPIDGQICLTLNSSTGILIIKPIPQMYKELNVVVGTERDLQNILIDEVFEEVVLKDCERE